MKRMFLLLTVAALMAAMVAANSATVYAQDWWGEDPGEDPGSPVFGDPEDFFDFRAKPRGGKAKRPPVVRVPTWPDSPLLDAPCPPGYTEGGTEPPDRTGMAWKHCYLEK